MGEAREQFFNTDKESENQDAVWRQAEKLLYFRFHHFTEAKTRDFIAPSRFASRSANYELARKNFQRAQSEFQSRIMGIYFDGVRNTLEAIGGSDTIDDLGHDKIGAIFAAIYASNPDS